MPPDIPRRHEGRRSPRASTINRQRSLCCTNVLQQIPSPSAAAASVAAAAAPRERGPAAVGGQSVQKLLRRPPSTGSSPRGPPSRGPPPSEPLVLREGGADGSRERQEPKQAEGSASCEVCMQPSGFTCASGDSLPGCNLASASPIQPALLGAPREIPMGAPSLGGPSSNAFAFVGEDSLANEVEGVDTPQFIRGLSTSSGSINAPSSSFPGMPSCCCIAASSAAIAAIILFA